MRRWVLLVLGLFILAVGSWGEAEGVSQAEVSDWVKLAELNLDIQDQDHHSQDGMRYILHERQNNWAAEEQYTRNVALLENDSGVQNAGKLDVQFNPAHQELIFHTIRVVRDGQSIDKLDLSKIQVIQPEAELEAHTVTGIKTAVLFIADLRVNDILEYSYTLRGKNPLFKDHDMMAFYTQWAIPIGRQYIRVLCPADAPLKIRAVKTDILPVESEESGLKSLIWDIREPETIAYEDQIPTGFEAYPYVELSNYSHWKRVVDWALPLYQPEAEELPAALETQIDQWRKDYSSDERRVLEIIRFLQDEIRYTGIQLGAQAYRPADPFETYRLRYGDCKGKSVLLCVILKELGIEAYPALVDTVEREHVAKRLPSPYAFDHVIVKIFFNGETIWVDPTRQLQGGGLRSLYLPDYGKALVLKKGVEDFERIPPKFEKAKVKTKTTITIPDYESPVQLDIKTMAYSGNADHLRMQIENLGKSDLDQSYLNYTALFYPTAKMTKSAEVSDNREHNILTIHESYELETFWEWSDDDGCWYGEVSADLLDSYLPNPEVRSRKMPLGLGFPMHREQEVVMHLPDSDWNIPEETKQVHGPGFELEYLQKLTGSKLTYTYKASMTAREVAVEDIPLYFEKADEFANLSVRALYHHEDVEQSMNWMMVVIALFGAAGTASICRRIWKIKGRKRDEKKTSNDWKPRQIAQPIGGFLILVAIGLCIAPLVLAFQALELSGAFSMQVWQMVAVPGSEQYIPMYGPLIIYEVLGNILLFGFSILLIALFFGKRRTFPVVFVAARVFGIVFVAVDSWLAGIMLDEMAFDPQIVGTVFWAGVFSIYMLTAQRVKDTFLQ